MGKSIQYQICSKTVMDTSDSEISFDSDGVCDHVTNYYKNVIPKLGSLKDRKITLEKKISEIKLKGKDKEYDCLLGLSGGLDSSYMLHLVTKEFYSVNLNNISYNIISYHHQWYKNWFLS